MRTLILLSIVALLGCTAAGPAAYSQAAPAYRPVRPPPIFTPGYSPNTPPEPAHTPTGAGASHGGLAAPEKPGAGRSPNKRVLPVSDKPGIWAADRARAVDPREKPPDTPLLLGVVLPFPLAAETDRERELTRWCAYKMGNAVGLKDPAGYARRFPPDVKKCLAARLYEHCANMAWGVYEAAERAGDLYSLPDLERIKAAQETARAFRKAACTDVPPNPDADKIHDEATALYDLEIFSP